MPRIRKKTSKRVTTHQRSKIQHKVSESRKKKKKESKKNPQWKSRKPKDPGIPSNYPFKEQILAEAAEAKRLAEEERQSRKEQKAAAKRGGMLAEVNAGTQAQTESEDDAKVGPEVPPLKDSDFLSLKEVLEKVDVVLQVLDARDPLPYRSQWVEDKVKSEKGKRLGFVLNKIDLVPRESAAQWKDYLRASAPTVLFHASSRVISSGQKDNVAETFSAVGVDALTEILGQWASEKRGKEPLRVAFVGMVNSGKSAIINALKRENHVPVYSRSHPGMGFSTTPHPIRVSMDIQGHKIELVDSPGLMKQNNNGRSGEIRVRDMLYRNKGKVDKVKDPLPAVHYIVSRCSTQDLMLLYSLPAFPDKDTNAFLKAFARSRGLVQKRGDLDTQGAAKSLLKDWAINKFPCYTLPPLQDTSLALSDEKMEAIYQKYDSASLEGLKAINTLWAGDGLVKFEPSTIDTRGVIFTGVEVPKEDASDEEPSSDEEKEADIDEDSAISSDEEEGVEIPQSSTKRKRHGSLALDKNVKPKKVSFVKEPPKTANKTKVQLKAKAPARKIGSTKKSDSNAPSGGDHEAYDFSKFF